MSALLGNGISALTAFSRALSTVSHNVANASTPGYSRQRLELSARPGTPYGFGFVGAGVQVDSIRRVVDQFHVSRMLDSRAELGRLGAMSGLAARIDKAVSDPGTGLSRPWSNFLDSTQGVASQPTSTAARQDLLAQGSALGNRLRSLDGQLKAMNLEINGKLGAGIDEANRLSSEIARINQEIVRQRGAAGGQSPNDLLDQRERLLQELSGLTGATAVLQDDGAMSVFTPNGQALVVGTNALRLSTVADPYRPERLELAVQNPSGLVELGRNAVGGELAGLLEFRDGVLDQTAVQLGRIAATTVFSFNAQHAQGVDLYGDAGGAFFRPIAPTVAEHRLNSGSGALSARLVDVGAFNGRDVALSFDGGSWSAVDSASGQVLPLTGTGTAADPLRINGIAVEVAGAPAAGDRFLLQPATGAAARVQVAIADPSRIAAASPLKASAALTNLGSAQIALTVTDPAALNFAASHDIVFSDAGTYTLDGAGPNTYDPAVGIVVGGVSLKIDGSPVAGDQFQIRPRGPGSSDNGNARLLAALGELGQLEGGNVSLNGALGALTVSVGSAARYAESSLEAQGIIDGQLVAEREAVSGVNLDEEAANLLRYQQAYQAAAQVIAAADTLFQSLINAVRR